MAKLMLIGPMAQVEILSPGTEGNEDGELVKAVCYEHSTYDGRLAPPGNCTWSEEYDTLDDAAEYAADHANRG